MAKIDIVVPVLNEQSSVEELVLRVDKAMVSSGIDYKIIFVDDRSTDNTVKVIKKLAKKYPIALHIKQGKPGKAYSILEGSKISRARVIAMLDGDLQYPPEALPKMYFLAKTHHIVVANRKKDELAGSRRIGSALSTRVVGKMLSGLSCDIQSGLKVFRRCVIESIDENRVKAWSIDLPLLYSAHNLGGTVGTVDIDFKNRTAGKSKVKFFKTASEITLTALQLKYGGSRPLPVKGRKNKSMLGAGVIHNRKKYITHTNLPHQTSALLTLTPAQKLVLAMVFAGLFFGLFINYLATLIVLTAILSIIYFADVLFSGYVLLKSLHFPPELKFDHEEIEAIDDKKLPIYTILCPLYKEGRVLGEFINSIKQLNWPKEKLEVLLLLEEDDKETKTAAKKLDMPSFIRIITVPDSNPRTKPKACNFGLLHAKGEYVVVYDAEDRPDPLQLKKSYLGFKKFGKNIFCLQSKLNYYNPNHNVLTRLFTAEYSLWFDVILPGLQSIESSIPLGGTSNHFRVKDLIKIRAWDPFNVTEDCDLGVRIFKAGLKTAIIDSTTLEEANSSAGNWIRQRSRWIKGYFQTYLVHMRHPVKFFREYGIHALTFQLVIGMRMTFMIINPFLWLMTVSYFMFRSSVGVAIESLYPAPVFYMAAFALVVGNFMYIFNYMIGSAKRGHYGLIKYVFLIPFYWILTSVAAIKALYQLAFKPHFWEKTHHGLHIPEAKLIENSVSVKSFNENRKYGRRFLPGYAVPAGAFLVGAMIISNFTDFLTSTYLGRRLTPEEFGLIALMTSFMFIVQLPSAGLSQTLSHKSAYLFGKYGAPVGELWKVYQKRIFAISIPLSVLWLAMSPILASIFNSHTLVPFIVFSPLWVFMLVGALSNGYLEGSLNFAKLALVIVISALSKFVLSVLFVEAGLSQYIYSALPISYLISLIIIWILTNQIATNNLGLLKNTKELKVVLKFPRKFYATTLLTNISSISFLSVDLLFAKHFLSPIEAGQYAILAISGRIVFIAGSLFSQFIMPIISKNEGAGEESGNTFIKLLLSVFASSFIAFLVVGPLGFITIPILFGNRAEPIIPYLVPFTFSIVLFSMAYSLVLYHQAKKQYLFALAGITTAIFQGFMLIVFHRDINQVVMVMLVSGAYFLLSSIILHVFYGRVVVLASNLLDFIGLFWARINGKKRLANGKLRILIYNWRDIKHDWAGGAEVYVHELAKRFVNKGHNVTVFCGNDGHCKREEEIDGVRIIRRGGFYTVYLWAFLYYVRYFRRRYDVIVESENGTPFFTPLYSSKPKLLIIHHVNQEVFQRYLPYTLSLIARLVESKLMPLFYRNVNIVAVSQSTRKELLDSNFVAEDNSINIVSPGVDTAVYKKCKKTAYPSFIYLGRHRAYKNINIAIKAFALVYRKYPDSRFTIAGEGETTAELKRLVNTLGLGNVVKFSGKVSDEEKIKLLGQNWASIQPSSYEGWGITVLESNACGTMVVASNVKGLRDSVVDGKTGFLVKDKDERAFARMMVKIIKDSKLRKRMSANAYKWAQGHDWDLRAHEFMSIIENIMSNESDVFVASDLVPNINYSYEEK